MVDAAGTTLYTYTAGNRLLTEDGPFTSDTITNTYVNRLQTKLSLQQPTGVWTNGFTYDSGARLSNVKGSEMNIDTFVWLGNPWSSAPKTAHCWSALKKGKESSIMARNC